MLLPTYILFQQPQTHKPNSMYATHIARDAGASPHPQFQVHKGGVHSHPQYPHPSPLPAPPTDPPNSSAPLPPPRTPATPQTQTVHDSDKTIKFAFFSPGPLVRLLEPPNPLPSRAPSSPSKFLLPRLGGDVVPASDLQTLVAYNKFGRNQSFNMNFRVSQKIAV